MDAGVFFVVHVWRDGRGFHASARDVTREQIDEFDDPVALARFLATHPVLAPLSKPGDEV